MIDIALRAPTDSSDKKPLEVCALCSEPPLARAQIVQRHKRGFIACIGPYTSSIMDGSGSDLKAIQEILITTPQSESPTFLLQRLRLRFYENTLAPKAGVALRTNIAERFPLENPTILAYFRVQRPTILACLIKYCLPVQELCSGGAER